MSDTTTTIYLIRHAQGHPTNRVDEPEWPLSKLGRRQAGRLPELLASLHIERIVSSPYARCLDTIGPFASASGIDIAIDAGLRERRITLELRKDFSEVLARSWEDFGFALPGCENSGEAQRRIRAAIEDAAQRHAGRTVAVCSHGNVISLFLNSIDSGFGLEEMMQIRNPDVLRLRTDAAGVQWDRTFRLEGLNGLATNHSESPIEW